MLSFVYNCTLYIISMQVNYLTLDCLLKKISLPKLNNNSKHWNIKQIKTVALFLFAYIKQAHKNKLNLN